MTIPLLDPAPPDGAEVLIAWLSPLGETRDSRPSGAVLPYRQVHRISGPDDGLVDHGVYSVSTFDTDSESAQREAWITHRRIKLLAPAKYGFIPQARVTLASGQVVRCDGVTVIEAPREVDYSEGASFQASAPYSRFVGTYQIDLRFVATPQ